MTLKKYLYVMAVLSFLAGLLFFFVADLIDPERTNWLGFLLFYSSLFVFLSGIASLLGFLSRFVILKRDLVFNSVKIAFRQSFMFSLFVISSLILKAEGLFSWLNISLLLAAFLILEVFMISYKKNNPQ